MAKEQVSGSGSGDVARVHKAQRQLRRSTSNKKEWKENRISVEVLGLTTVCPELNMANQAVVQKYSGST